MTTAPAHPPPIALARRCAALALPRNDTLITLGEDDVLARWHLAPDGDARAVVSLSIAPSHTLVAASPHTTAGLAVAVDGALVVFDLDEHAPACARFPAIEAAPPARCAWLGTRAVLLAPDGVAILGADGTATRLALAASAVDATPDSLVVGDATGAVRVLAPDGAEARRWHAHDGGVIAVVCLPGGTHVLTAGRDGALRTWAIATGERRDERVIGTLDAVRAQGDGALIWVTSSEIRIVCPPGGDPEETTSTTTALYATTPGLAYLSYRYGRDLVSPDQRWLMSCSTRPQLHELSADGMRATGVAPGPAQSATALVGGDHPHALVPRGTVIERWAFIADTSRPLTRATELRFLGPQLLASAHASAAPVLRDAATGSPLGSFGAESWKLHDLHRLASGRHLVHTEYGAQLLHLDHTIVELGPPPRTARTLPDHPPDDHQPHIALAGGDRVVIVRRGRKRLEIRDVVTDKLLLDTAGPGHHDRGWVLPGEPLRLALCRSAYTDEPLVIWDVAAGSAIAEIAGPTLAARRACLRADRLLTYCPPTLSGSGPLTAIVLWDLATRTSHVLDGHAGKPTAVAFGTDGALAFSADESVVIAWDLDTRTRRWNLVLGGREPRRLVSAGTDHLLVECGLFGPHVVVRIGDGARTGTIEGALAGPARSAAGAPLVGVIQRGELVLHDAATCAPVDRWRGTVEATAWAQSEELAIAVGDACGELALLDPPP